MFEFFKKKKSTKSTNSTQKPQDWMEKSLWDMKELYDMETEEVEKVVLEKRSFSFIRNEKIQN
jgi:hypothetical protein|tara:strand:- start:184 stop:372 length:189 start_codon:yes stop_codon:yes gene_type:complete